MTRKRKKQGKAAPARGVDFDDFAIHPRFGQGPRETGLNPTRTISPKPGEALTLLHWHSEQRIANTAVEADWRKQKFTVVPVTHYFDVVRTCRDCGLEFIFYALEQKHWYEELGFVLDADCVRCVRCRKVDQALAAQRRRYETLMHAPERSDEESLDMAECCMALVEAALFSPHQTERVRMLLNATAATAESKLQQRREQLRARLVAFAAGPVATAR
jgi:hypothetical protein